MLVGKGHPIFGGPFFSYCEGGMRFGRTFIEIIRNDDGRGAGEHLGADFAFYGGTPARP